MHTLSHMHTYVVTLGCSLVSVDKDKPVSQKGSDRWVAAVMFSVQTLLSFGWLDLEFFDFTMS